MSRSTLIATGSNTGVFAGSGRLYGVHVNNGNGAAVLIQDSATGLGQTPDYNSFAATGLVERLGPVQNAGPNTFNFHGVTFTNGLTVAATSNAAVTVYWSE